MEEEKQVSWVKGYGLRLALVVAPALFTVFGSTTQDLLVILGVGLILSGGLQWLLAHRGNRVYLSTMWTVSRAKVQPGKKARSQREKEKQLSERRREVLERAKGEGKTMGVTFAVIGAIVILAGVLAF